MAKVILKGTFHEVLEPETVVGISKDYKKQRIVFIEPGFRDSFGEQKSKDAPWEMEVFGETLIEKLKLKPTDAGRKATITVFVEGFVSDYTAEQKAAGKKDFFGYRVKLWEVEFFVAKGAAV